MAFLTPEHLVERLYLKPGNMAADFGAGSGAYCMALSKEVGEMGKVYAIDINRDLLDTLKTTFEKMGYLNIETIWGDMEEGLHLDAYSLDAVVLSNVLFQLDNPKKAIEEAARVLNPGGRVLCVDWSGSHGGIGPKADHVVSERKAEELFHDAGFQVGERLPAGSYHYAFIATKL